MSAGQPWIDKVMAPLSGRGLEASDYNRIYEAVSRGTAEEGAALVFAILNAIRRGPGTTITNAVPG